MTEQDYIDHWEFASDLSTYLESEDTDTWQNLTQNYPFESLGGGRYVFLPESHERVNEEQPSDYLVRKPQNVDRSPIDRISGDVYDHISQYLKTDDAARKLELLAQMEDNFDHTWTSDSTVRFGPTEENGVEVGVPGLAEIAEAYNSKDDSYFDELDKKMLGRIASDNSTKLGLVDKTVFYQEGDIFVQEDVHDGVRFYQVDEPGEAIPLSEAFRMYGLLRDTSNDATGKEIFDNINEIFPSTEQDGYRIVVDSVNEEALLFDLETIEAEIRDFSDANDWLDRFEGERVMNKIADFYSGLIWDDEP